MPGKQNDADKRGYLLENFRLFHPMGLETDTFPYHYHEFHKILVFLSGSLTYLVEGRKYVLRPGDLLLIPAHAIHQPIIDPNTPYDRILLGTINANMFPGQLALAQALAAAGKELTAVALGSPYELPLLPDCACKLAAFDYSTTSFRALLGSITF